MMNMISTADASSLYEEVLRLHGQNLTPTSALSDDRAEEHYRALQSAARRLLAANPSSDRAALHYTRWTTELAHLCRACGNPEEAKALYKEALETLEPLRREQRSCWRDYAGSFYIKLALLYAAEDRHTHAEAMYRRAVALAEEVPAEHDRALWNTRMLAFYLLRRERFAEADELYTRTLDTARTFSETHSLRTYLNIFCEACQEAAFFCRMTDRPGQAEALLQELLTESRRLAVRNPARYSADPALVCTELRLFYQKYGHAEKAEEYRREAAEIWRNAEVTQNLRTKNALLSDSEKLHSCLAAVRARQMEPGPRFADLCFSVWMDGQAAELQETDDLLQIARDIARKHRYIPLCGRIVEAASVITGNPAE